MEADYRTVEEEVTIKKVSEMPESDILQAASVSGDYPDAAAKLVVDNPLPVTVKRTMTSTGARVSAQIRREEDSEESEKEKMNVASRMSFDDFLRVTNTKVMTTEEYLRSQAIGEPKIEPSEVDESRCEPNSAIRVKDEADVPHIDGLNAEEKKDEPLGEMVADKVNVASRMSYKEFLKATNLKVMTTEEYLSSWAKEEQKIKQSEMEESRCESNAMIRVKEEPDVPQIEGLNAEEKREESTGREAANKVTSTWRMSFDEFLKATNTKVMTTEEYLRSQAKEEREIKQSEVEESRCGLNAAIRVKEEPDVGFEGKRLNEQVESVDEGLGSLKKQNVVKRSTDIMEEFEQWCQEKSTSKPIVGLEHNVSCEGLNSQVKQEAPIEAVPISWAKAIVPVKDEPIDVDPINCSMPVVTVKQEPSLGVGQKPPVVKEEPVKEITRESFMKKFNRIPSRRVQASQSTSDAKKRRTEDQKPCLIPVEDGDFPEEPDWFLVGRTMVTALSTTKGRKLADNEIVHFSSSSKDWGSNAHWIVRFSTKRHGEIGRLPMEWGKCVVPLVSSAKVKVYGRCIAAPSSLSMMQDIMLYVSFYIHRSIFTDDDNSSWGRKLEAVHIDSTIYPLLTLFKWLKIKPYQKAEYTPEELDSRKRLLNLEAETDEAGSMLPIVKRRKGCQQYPEQGKDEQAVSQSSLNKLVGAVDAYNLEVMEPPNSLTCNLRTYQKQALHWMSELEKGIDVEKATKTLHPCWAAYRISDERASSIYVNLFSGEATTRFPTATQMARGGILADAMGLGKTVMTIALILKSPRQGRPDDQGLVKNAADSTKIIRKDSQMNATFKPKGGTLIICPMALLSQWKDELETHSETGSISIFVHYGGGRAHNPKEIAEHDVVLTTYGVLSNAYKSEGEDSIFYKVDWYRVVLDEAHTIKCWKTQVARACFTLSSYCRWCLTGTPIQNNLEDLYSLLCFLHVEPWCNWAWWNKLIQKPYENGDPRGLRLIKAILRPLMLRRTKESKDKEGRPILVLPPTDIQIIECEMTETEQDFYDALFKRSKVQFDQFVAQGKVLHNYASILELLLRLRQCCNHPFLVMSRADSQKYADLNKLARRFFGTDPDSAYSAPNAPTKAYVEEVLEGIRRGESSECPICMESADDPVLTPCAHRMCRECLLSTWRSPAAGLCPLCRQMIRKTDLITCPSESRFLVDVERNWKESSKISSLLNCLERIHHSGSCEKSIVFSQWTTFLDLLEIPLKREGIGYLRYDGGLTQKQRERVLYEFNETKDKTVLLMSLRAGGVGLNLTAASNVFLMDPWWNPAVEEQAIMRIHRIGQKRTVSVRRFIVKDTLEERMQQVQARKQRLIAGALTDEEVRYARIEELKMLFR